MSIGIGETLRQAREDQGRTLQEAARDTRIRGEYLEALEQERFEVIGGDVYAKGFLSTYARYLHLDPAPLLDQYRSVAPHQEYDATALATRTPRQPKEPLPRWVSWVVAVVVVIGGIVVLGNVFGGRSPAPAPERTEPTVAGPTATPSDGGPATEEARPTPTPTPTFDGVNVTLLFEERSWVRIQIDGENLEEGVIEAGEVRELQGDDAVTVRFGNAGGVRVELNGQDLGTQGGRGEVRTVTFTQDGPTA